MTGASRADETTLISTLGTFTKEDINMFSLVIIGNSKTRRVGDWMITPRGYQKREPGLWIFVAAGTQDGREIVRRLCAAGYDVAASVVSSYGEQLLSAQREAGAGSF